MRGRGFTLIEVLIALALLVTMLSLVGPALMGRLAPMTFDRASGQLGAAIRLAQERARLEGVVLYLYAEADEPGGVVKLTARRSPLDDETLGENAGIGGIAGPRPDESAIGGADRTGVRDVLLELPDGYRFTHEPPADAGFGEMPPEPGQEKMQGAITPPDNSPVNPNREMPDLAPDLIAACLPDGSITAPRPVWLVDAENRAAVLRIDGAVGSVRMEKWSAASGDDLDATPEMDDLLPPETGTRPGSSGSFDSLGPPGSASPAAPAGTGGVP